MPQKKKRRTKKKNPKRVKAGRKSKNKGSNFERKIANDLEKRYGDPSLPIMQRNFRRTPMSGGFRQDFPGDIVVPDWFPFAIEAKKYNTAENVLDITTLPHKGEEHQLLKWWDEEQQKAKPAKKALIIVFSKGRNKPLVLIDYSILSRLDFHLAKGLTEEGTLILTIRSPKRDLVCLAYDALFNRATIAKLSSLAEYIKKGNARILEHNQGKTNIIQEAQAQKD